MNEVEPLGVFCVIIVWVLGGVFHG